MKKLFLSALLIFQLFAFTAFAQNKYSLVDDEYGLLSDSEVAILQQKASEIAAQYDCGVYIAVVEDMDDCDVQYSDAFGIEAYAQYYFFGNNLGVGESGDGIFLVMSMAERDYDIMAHGNFGNYAFTDYGKDKLADSFLSDFGNNDWFEGFSHFLTKTESMLKLASEGNPLDVGSKNHNLPFSIAVGLIFGFIVALISCGVMKSSMKKVKIASGAVGFISENGINIASKSDLFTHNTVVRHKNSSYSGGSGGGTHINSSGSSHHSGKF